MCGRYSLTKPIKTLKEHFKAVAVALDHHPRFNIAPSQQVPVVIAGKREREIHALRWGLIPSWAKDPKKAAGLINARAETVHEKPSFRSSFKKRRCLVPADGFYEWQVQNNQKFPQYIRKTSGGLFAFAGLWSEWDSGQGILQTFTIITTTANRQLQPIHDRMPVILPPEHYHTWMAPDTPAETLKTLLTPLAENTLEHYEVSKHVNSPGNDDEECILPAADN
ncbi:MAG: hypothetical protein GWM98_14495 [Nitrospinaceae bacterium]|nr:SOS response-associated peptidase [Nitrospinaceae bacterium]NIR55459.1 SOS response-associated peptidase [Nitrospinaceae bacterium]NIS85899.1 SOS response-associated peptidase [Nitrospinaceae bacterium]NIT82743.1 SOS response-associated peptidase [Nitrospinaceae bacterium]NIU44952.1 SOS response-associated peptidase [Nitrospinaceae bacterium]